MVPPFLEMSLVFGNQLVKKKINKKQVQNIFLKFNGYPIFSCLELQI